VPELSNQAFEDFQGKYDVMVDVNSRVLRLAQRAESRRISRKNLGVREAENDQQRNRRLNPETRSREQSVDTSRQAAARKDEEVREAENEQRRNRWLVSEYREQEQSINTDRRAAACKDEQVREAENEQRSNRRSVPEYREQEQSVNMDRQAAAREDEQVREAENEQRCNRRSVLQYREQEQSVNTKRRAAAREDEEVRERENEQQPNRWETSGVQENELTNRAAAKAKRTYDMACTYKNGKFCFGPPCGSWSIPCVHGCGYIHLSSSMPGMRKKCCANGRMSINSNNCDSKLLANLELRDFPLFMRQAMSSSPEFCHHSSTYNNLFAMGATKVCNYSERPGFKNRGPDPFSVHLQGKLYHSFNLANSTNNSGRIGYFVFDNESALEASASSHNLDSRIMDIIARGLREINPYSCQLSFLGLEARQRADGVHIIPRVLNQRPLFDECSVHNDQKTGEMSIQIKAHNDDVSSVKMNSEKVEPLFFTILFLLGEDGWTNDLNSLSAKSILAGEKLVATYSIST
jgi:hypothetical protein